MPPLLLDNSFGRFCFSLKFFLAAPLSFIFVQAYLHISGFHITARSQPAPSLLSFQHVVSGSYEVCKKRRREAIAVSVVSWLELGVRRT